MYKNKAKENVVGEKDAAKPLCSGHLQFLKKYPL